MNVRSFRIFTNGILSLVFLAAGSFPAFGFFHDAPCVANEITLQQLKSAQRATARFNSIQAAEMAGYEDIDLEIPGMGAHYVNWDLVPDGTFDPAMPEALVYADLGNGHMRLVAVEYLAPYDEAGPPAGFEGSCDQWSPFPSAENPALWTLHAWIWQPNLSGTFAKFNPLIP